MPVYRSSRPTSSCGSIHAISAWRSKKLKQRSISPRPIWPQPSPALNWEKSRVPVADATLRSAEAQAKDSDTTLMRAMILAKDRFGTQAALDDAQAAEVKAHSEVDQATANLAYENQQLVVIDANVGREGEGRVRRSGFAHGQIRSRRHRGVGANRPYCGQPQDPYRRIRHRRHTHALHRSNRPWPGSAQPRSFLPTGR
jgi:hypothetical protein